MKRVRWVAPRKRSYGNSLARGWLFWLVLILVGFAGSVGAAGGEKDIAIQVVDIEPVWIEDRLVVSAQCKNLFSRKSISTLQSGLPAVVQIDIGLLEAERAKTLFSDEKGNFRTVRTVHIARSITYNIWDERYAIREGDDTAIYGDFATAEREVGRLGEEWLAEAAQLEPEATYAVRIRAQIIPISAEQGDKIADWLRNPHKMGEELADDSGESGFQLNVSRLISSFWEKGKKARNRSAWHVSEPFKGDPVD
ncbi:MAG: DUF4390 domain-containing protein [Gemmatimonadetes bacterium]|nr:DUF4390 domain-containing protein [Gemmatimonadota bacterium]